MPEGPLALLRYVLKLKRARCSHLIHEKHHGLARTLCVCKTHAEPDLCYSITLLEARAYNIKMQRDGSCLLVRAHENYVIRPLI